MNESKIYKNTSYLPLELSHKIQEDKLAFIKQIIESKEIAKRYPYHAFITQEIITFYCMKFTAPQCLRYMLEQASNKEENYQSMFKVLIAEEQHSAFYYGINLLDYFHRPENRYFDLLGEKPFLNTLFRSAAMGKKKVFTLLLKEYLEHKSAASLLNLHNDNGQRLLDILFDNKMLESMKIFIDTILPLDRKALFYYVNQVQLENGNDPYLNKLSFFQKYCNNTESDYRGIEAYEGSMNKKQKQNEEAYRYLQPLFDKIYENPEYAGFMATIAAFAGSNFILEKMPVVEQNPTLYIAYQATLMRQAKGDVANLLNTQPSAYYFPNRYKLYMPFLKNNDIKLFFPYNESKMKKHPLETSGGDINMVEENTFLHDWFSLSQFNKRGSILGTLARKNDWQKVDKYGNTHLHILAQQILDVKDSVFNQSRETYFRFFEDMFNWQPELFLKANKEGERVVDYIQLFKPYMQSQQAPLDIFKEKTLKYEHYFKLQEKLALNEHKTKKLKI